MKNIRLVMLCILAILLETNADAQGIRVYKNNGTMVEVLYSELDSIVGVPDNGDVNSPVISLEGHSGNKNGENKDSYIMFGLGCTSKDASYAEMFVANKKDIDNLTDNGISLIEIADANMGNGVILNNDELNTINSGIYWLSMDNTDGVLANTEYTCIAFVKNTNGYAAAVRYDVKTDNTDVDDSAPAVSVNGRAGDAEGNMKSEAVTFTVSCDSKNASYAEAFVSESSFINEILKDITLEDLMIYNAGIGKILPNEDIDKLNNGSLSLTWDQLAPETSYSLLFCVKTKGGGMTVKRCDVKTESAAMYSGNVSDNKIKGLLHKNNIKLK